MAKVTHSSTILNSLFINGLGLILYIFSFSSASANLVTVESLGTSYVDQNTAGGPWVLLGYGSNGKLGSPLTTANGTFDSARQGSATLNALAFARTSSKFAISWNQSGKPNGGIESYEHAVSFAFPDPSLLTLSAATQPAAGPNSGNWSMNSTVSSTIQVNLITLKGTPNLPSVMFARRETFGARYATAYGFSKSLTSNPQLDWYEDSQAFNVLHLGISSNGYVAGGGGGTNNGYIPSTMAIWAKMPTSSNQSNETYTFTNAGATGSEGPTQAQVNTAYAETNLAGQVTINTQGIQEWIVPTTGNYRIEAMGAKGGGTHGGKGAKMSGTFPLSANSVLKILVGQAGTALTSGRTDYSGGGGTFVIKEPYDSSAGILVIAGGGGGAHVHGSASQGSVSTSGANGAGGHQNGLGGTDGNGGSKDNQTTDGGAGFLTNGQSGNPDPSPQSFTNGGKGGSNSWSPVASAEGGFGGGGGTNRNSSSYFGTGGGGGFSGGGSSYGTSSNPPLAGGGGSYNSGTDQNNSAGANQDHGRVIITYLSGTTGSPLNNGLVAWYPLDGDGTDQSATANHATVHGATPTADRHGEAGKALLFEGSGSNDYLQAPFSQALSSSSFSYSVWAKPTSTTNNHGSPITFRSNGRGFNLYKTPDNIWSYWTGNGGWQIFDAQPITLDWTALAFTHDGTTGKGYQNGVLVVFSNKPYLSAQSGPLRIGTGSGDNGPVYFFKGAIDEVRIWNRVLSAEEISSLYAMEKPKNSAPTELNSTAALFFYENQPAGTLIGDFNATDPDANASLAFSLQSGSNLFSLDANGTLRTLHSLDYETNSTSYTVSVRVTDEHNASLDGNFTITLLNEVEDLDGDGIEDHYDPDDDGDGFSDATEIGYGSDPRDHNSVANAAPNSLELNGSTILENQPAGTIIGRLSGTDPDANATLSFSLVDENVSGLSLDANGTLRTLHSLDYETNSTSYTVSARVTDEHNASLDGNFTITLLNEVEDLDGDGVEDHYDSDDDGDGFPDATENAYGSDPRDPNSVANAAPNSLELNGTSILENQPAGTVIGRLSGTDPDANATLSFSLVDGNASGLSLDANGTLRALHSLDFETNPTSYVISARVTDEHNASLDGNFTITLFNEVEDLDGDGIEDHYDPDDDGDGFSDATEIDYGSDPRDPNSVANAAPNSLELNGSTILENQPAGTVIGRLSGTDPDANATLSFSLVDENAFGLSLDANGTLRALYSLDYETNSTSYTISVRVTDEHNASLDGNFTIALLNQVEDLDGDGIEDHYDSDDDGDGFSDATEIDYGSDPRDPDDVVYLMPELGTIEATLLENGRVSLSARFKANSDFALPSFAFELSGNSDFKNDLRSIPGLVEQDQIHGSVPDLKPGTSYHVRLLATHQAKQIRSPSVSFQTEPVIKHWWESENPAESGWRVSPWLGSFRPYTNGWIYHLELGWAYAQSDGQDGLWLWMEAEGWVWSAPQCWPHLWKDRSTNWLYLVKEHEGKPALYDYSTESFRWK